MLAAIPLTLLAAAGSAAPNVLYLISDDLRPEFGAYNQSAMHTPNVDRLAAEGTVRRCDHVLLLAVRSADTH